MQLEKSCAVCDSTSKNVAVACCQSRPYSIMSSFLPLYLNKTPPTGFVCSASKFFSTLRTCNLRKVVLFVTLRQRAWPWRAVKVGHFEFSGSFFQCLGTNSSQGFCSFCFKIGQYSQMMVLNKQCPICDSMLKGVALACRQSWFCGLCFQRLWTNSPQGIYQFCFKIGEYIVLFVTLRQRAWPWRAVKVGHFSFSGLFFHCLWTNSSQGICPFCF